MRIFLQNDHWIVHLNKVIVDFLARFTLLPYSILSRETFLYHIVKNSIQIKVFNLIFLKI